MLRWKFTTANLPEYLEEALAPFAWTGVFSADFRSSIIGCIFATNREEVTQDFVATLKTLKFLDKDWTNELCDALTRFAKEGFPARNNQ